jgi:hypothetical protein
MKKNVQQGQDGARAIVRTFRILNSFPHCCNRYNLSSGLVLFDQTGSQDLKRQTKCTGCIGFLPLRWKKKLNPDEAPSPISQRFEAHMHTYKYW